MAFDLQEEQRKSRR